MRRRSTRTSVSDEVVIRFDHVTKTYNLYKNDRGRFLGIFNYKKKGTFLGSVNASEDLSFEVKKGEAVAFLGRNGAGKSTALKMVTGVTHPTSGEVEVKGARERVAGAHCRLRYAAYGAREHFTTWSDSGSDAHRD